MRGSQAQATGRVNGDCRVWSQGFTGSQGAGLTWGPTVQQLHKVGWEGSQLPVLLPQPPAVLNLGRRRTQGHLVLPQGSLENSSTLVSVPILSSAPSSFAPSLSHFCVPQQPQRPHPLFTHLSPRDELQHLRPKPLITSSPHLLYHFHSLPSLQLQLVCLLWDVVEVHLAPSLGAPRFGRATWSQTREKEAAGAALPSPRSCERGGPGAPKQERPAPPQGGALYPRTNHRPRSAPSAPPRAAPRAAAGAAGAAQVPPARPLGLALSSPRRRAQRGLGASPAARRYSGIAWKRTRGHRGGAAALSSGGGHALRPSSTRPAAWPHLHQALGKETATTPQLSAQPAP